MTETEREELAQELRASLRGEVRFDETSRLLYASDASIYQMLPAGVVLPTDPDDVARVVSICCARRVPLLSRGAGTSLAGQTTTTGVVMDYSPHLRNVLEIDPAAQRARVQPGVVLDELNALLKPHGLWFAPDVATSNRATVGGMMGNNSCGARSLKYGKTLDHVLEQRVVLSDGTTAHFRELPDAEWWAAGGLSGLEGRVYRETQRLLRQHREEIDRRFPRILRRVGGYNLDEFVRRGSRNLAHLSVGSEGTLVAVTEATLNLEPLPAHAGLVVSHFSDLLAALDAVPVILEHEPAAVELIDRIILDLARGNRDLSSAGHFLTGEPDALLVTEFHADSEAELRAHLVRLRRRLEAAGLGYAHAERITAAEKKQVWDLRKAGLGLLMGMKGAAKPTGFVEDTAVPVERLSGFIRAFRKLLLDRKLDACYYGHASVGCLHVRPILDLKQDLGRRHLREISAAVAELVAEHGGAMSAEHGDGLARSEWQERMFGSEIYGAFRELKAAFDPHGIMNPGKIVDAPPMDHHLRARTAMQLVNLETVLDFSRDGGLSGHLELCSGVGACRKKLDGTMCPSYRATLEEAQSTRGRATLLRAVLTNQEGQGAPGLADPRLPEVMDLCLECKACKSECPSNVDMAKLKYEWLHHRNQEGRASLRSWLFGHAERLGKAGTAASSVANVLQELPLVRALLERTVGIDRRRKLPRWAHRTFDQWWATRGLTPRRSPRGPVMLLVDTYTRFQEPELGVAAVRLLQAWGFEVTVPELRCCGRPLISKGFLDEARANAEWNVAALQGAVRKGVPLLGLEPSCVATYRDEYRDFRLGNAAEEVARATWLVEDFLATLDGEETPYAAQNRDLLLHGHCHQKALMGMKGTLTALRAVPGYRVTEILSGCCGMAGSFGYEREHYELSMKIGEQSLFPPIRAAAEGTQLAAPGTSCRQQIRHGTGRTALHPVQLLASALSKEGT